ncbi:hypothetical protein CONLIGDRAFT_675144 [Coniochaeta ligniaria NRRL 30616]|uniref:Uncharacterized protein n=1 Tax=Coniochaeta ligniaria NRRL 30616 TaxID=1408157 RepID=A0A1J7IME0_9PEZI|nr:hypothetical protein CONLIGDRAFT_675144 [Coniochaeta ligniaria NRRL 30616]
MAQQHTALRVSQGLWRAVDRAIATSSHKATASIDMNDKNTLSHLLDHDPKQVARHLDLRLESIGPATVASLPDAHLGRLIDALPVCPQASASSSDLGAICALGVNLAKVYCDLAGTLHARCRRDHLLRRFRRGMSVCFDFDSRCELYMGLLQRGSHRHQREAEIHRQGWACIMPMQADWCYGALICTVADTHGVPDGHLFLSELSTLSLFLGQQLSAPWPGPPGLSISAIVVKLLNDGVRVIEAWVTDLQQPAIAFRLRDSFRHDSAESHHESVGERGCPIIVEPRCSGCRRALSWILFSDVPRPHFASLSPPKNQKHRGDHSPRTSLGYKEELRNTTYSTVPTSLSRRSASPEAGSPKVGGNVDRHIASSRGTLGAFARGHTWLAVDHDLLPDTKTLVSGSVGLGHNGTAGRLRQAAVWYYGPYRCSPEAEISFPFDIGTFVFQCGDFGAKFRIPASIYLSGRTLNTLRACDQLLSLFIPDSDVCSSPIVHGARIAHLSTTCRMAPAWPWWKKFEAAVYPEAAVQEAGAGGTGGETGSVVLMAGLLEQRRGVECHRLQIFKTDKCVIAVGERCLQAQSSPQNWFPFVHTASRHIVPLFESVKGALQRLNVQVKSSLLPLASGARGPLPPGTAHIASSRQVNNILHRDVNANISKGRADHLGKPHLSVERPASGCSWPVQGRWVDSSFWEIAGDQTSTIRSGFTLPGFELKRTSCVMEHFDRDLLFRRRRPLAVPRKALCLVAFEIGFRFAATPTWSRYIRQLQATHMALSESCPSSTTPVEPKAIATKS